MSVPENDLEWEIWHAARSARIVNRKAKTEIRLNKISEKTGMDKEDIRDMGGFAIGLLLPPPYGIHKSVYHMFNMINRRVEFDQFDNDKFIDVVK